MGMHESCLTRDGLGLSAVSPHAHSPYLETSTSLLGFYRLASVISRARGVFTARTEPMGRAGRRSSEGRFRGNKGPAPTRPGN